MAARRDGQTTLWDGSFDVAHAGLARLAAPDDILVGHNLHRFDRPQLEARAPGSPLLTLATLDTLELSVIAFPRRPYHALTKDDQLVRDALPNPVSDVRACERLLADATDALRALSAPDRDLLAALIPRLELPEHARRGWRALTDGLGWPNELPLDLRAAWAGQVCANRPELREPAVDLPLLMISAWLRAARHHDGSTLPGWVRRTWPETAKRLRGLRATSCGSCDWCAQRLSPEHWLREVFGFDRFRDEPAAPDGGSLQRLLVERGLRGESTFGILPTGGGKSLCFQVPAEARHRNLGQLTLVISPLQSLMKDQVDALAQRIPHARALYGGLPGLLRPAVIEEIRSGACGLLYLSPEQLRNASVLKLLGQREIGAVVFDEAHCLSQWGHDFRTDYPYVLRALRELHDSQDLPLPPVFLFTATAQADATREICAHVAEQTGAPVTVFDGGSARPNLAYAVIQIAESERFERAAALIEDHLGDGTAIVFCGSRKRTESVARWLTDHGILTTAYHAGLDADLRRRVQDAFLAGEHRVIAATNAFGMGVDKPDVRLVLHLDMPSSLEAWLQEAGRAGRDQLPATAVLLWAPGDAEPRFALGALADLDADDLQALWRAIRQLPASKKPDGTERREVTARELLFQEALVGRFDSGDPGEETRVKAGVNWLERARVLTRRENATRVFTGRPLTASIADGNARIDALGLPPRLAAQWKAILGRMFDSRDGLSADDLAVLCREMSQGDALEGGLRVLSMLTDMAHAGVISTGQTFSAFVAKGVAHGSAAALARWVSWEAQIAEAYEETDSGRVDLRVIADRLSDGAVCTPAEVGRLLATWSSAGRGQGFDGTAARFRQRRDTGTLLLERPAEEHRRWLGTRRQVAGRALDALLARAEGAGSQLLVSTELERVAAAIEADMLLAPRLAHVADATREAIAWMHELRVITVQSGLAVFRSAMRLDRGPSAPTLRDAEVREATAALARHQLHRILRVHVIDAWARLMLEDPARAEALRADWFSMPVSAFQARWFARRRAELERPTTPESYRAIVTDLDDPTQEAIVTRDPRKNHLVLAGPGSGKTRVLVHRVAWLLRCQRVRAKEILVICYTRANALELRRRLDALVGRDARGIRVQTLHSVAMRLVGHRAESGQLGLDDCIREATALLASPSVDGARQRDALLDGFGYLFIDEYQDIDADRYALLSALAGRAMGGEHRALRVFAVGDDDQAIYGYSGASTDFIRRFEHDYAATRFEVPHSYRVPRAALELAQDLIAGLPGRLKAGTRLTVDRARLADPPMGPWAHAHPRLRGDIPCSHHGSVRAAAHALMQTVAGWIADGVDPMSIAVLARTRRRGLHALRISAESLRVPFSWPLPNERIVPVSRVREVVRIRAWLDRDDELTGEQIAREIDALDAGDWTTALRAWLEPARDRRQLAAAWRRDLSVWAQLERRARTIGRGVHLGTMHGAKGLEFDHVLLLDDGSMADDPDERRLLYVALTRARRSLQLFTTDPSSPTFAALAHARLVHRSAPPLAADGPAPREYDLLARDALWIDWLGQQGPEHPGHHAMALASNGDRFALARRGARIAVTDSSGTDVGLLSEEAARRWAPRLEQGIQLKLIAATRELADEPHREPVWRERLRVPAWWTGVWEGRWRA